MNAATLIRAAEHAGLRLALTVAGAVKCSGPKLVTERWAPQLRQYKAEIVAALTAANDGEPPVRQLSVGEQSALAIAERAIAQAALTDEQKASRLTDLRRDPAIAKFWALAWPDR